MSEQPIRVDGKRFVSMPTAVLITILGVVATAAIAWSAVKADQQATNVVLADHAGRLKIVETKAEDLREIKNDISWIKQTMIQERARRSSDQ